MDSRNVRIPWMYNRANSSSEEGKLFSFEIFASCSHLTHSTRRKNAMNNWYIDSSFFKRLAFLNNACYSAASFFSFPTINKKFVVRILFTFQSTTKFSLYKTIKFLFQLFTRQFLSTIQSIRRCFIQNGLFISARFLLTRINILSSNRYKKKQQSSYLRLIENSKTVYSLAKKFVRFFQTILY